MSAAARPWVAALALGLLLAALALFRPIDHDESQYVAAAVLAADGLPYRDFAYLQTPLQPLLFAPLAALFGGLAWPGLRLVNALLGLAAVAATWGAARAAGAGARASLIAAGLFATTDILLFSVGVARNDALPAAMLAAARIPAMRATRAPASRRGAFLAGLLLAAAAAAKISYAFPAAAYGLWALRHRAHRPLWIALGAAGPCLLVAALWLAAPADFLFGVLHFPAHAPTDYYAAGDRAWKLQPMLKPIDALKFLALGPAIVALLLPVRGRAPCPARRLCLVLAAAGLVAALLPTPIWRQYLLLALPPLFVRLALGWPARVPRAWQAAIALFVAAGLAPSIAALASGRPATLAAMHESAAIRSAMDRAQVDGPVATLSPQFLPATGRLPDPRFAPGPFYYRARALLPPDAEHARGLVSAPMLAHRLGDPAAARPAAILVGGEGAWTSGDDRLDAHLEDWARAAGWRQVPVNSRRFRLYVPPQAIRATGGTAPLRPASRAS